MELLCLLNSALFRWFVDTISDGSHLNRRELIYFPVGNAWMNNETSELGRFAKQLSANLKEKSFIRRMVYKHDSLQVQCIVPRHAKPIIDEIDTVLAKHYGFTDEELDFILNYDIKYRLGLGREGSADDDDSIEE